MNTSNPQATRKSYWAIAILCIVCGGVAFVLFLNFFFREIHGESLMNASLAFRNASVGLRAVPARGGLSPLLATTFFSSVVSMLGGLALLSLLRAKEAREIKIGVIDTMVMPEEKTVIQELERNSGELTQSELVRATRLGKVKIHRIIKRLESLGIVKKYPYGLTNKIKLEKALYGPS